MGRFNYISEDFGPSWGSKLSGTNSLDCSWSEIIWAAITVGKRNKYDVLKHGEYSIFEIIFRTSMIYTYLEKDIDTNNIIKSSVYKVADPSEKTAISYYIGMILTKILANRLFDVPWIMHLDVYKSSISMKLIKKSKPDFIGLNYRREWFIFESKGRSNEFDSNALNKAKNQTRQLRTIDGQYPVMRAAVQSYFLSDDSLEVKILDPDEYDKDATDISIDFFEFFNNYYKLIIDLLDYNKNNQTVISKNQKDFIVVEIECVDVTIGLEKNLYKYFKNKKFDSENMFNKIKSFLVFDEYSEDMENKKTYIGNDGILVNCGPTWSKKFTIKNEENINTFWKEVY